MSRFRSIDGPVIDLPVAGYYDRFSLELAHDFPSHPQNCLGRHIGWLHEAVRQGGQELRPLPPVCAKQPAPPADGQLRAQDCRHWSKREAVRALRARQLRLPEDYSAPRVSPDEIRRRCTHAV